MRGRLQLFLSRALEALGYQLVRLPDGNTQDAGQEVMATYQLVPEEGGKSLFVRECYTRDEYERAISHEYHTHGNENLPPGKYRIMLTRNIINIVPVEAFEDFRDRTFAT